MELICSYAVLAGAVSRSQWFEHPPSIETQQEIELHSPMTLCTPHKHHAIREDRRAMKVSHHHHLRRPPRRCERDRDNTARTDRRRGFPVASPPIQHGVTALGLQ